MSRHSLILEDSLAHSVASIQLSLSLPLRAVFERIQSLADVSYRAHSLDAPPSMAPLASTAIAGRPEARPVAASACSLLVR